MILRIAIGQVNPLVGDIEGNVEKIIKIAHQARDNLQADAIVFPELILTGYPPEDLLLRPDFLVRVERALAHVAASIPGIVAILGFPELDGDRLFNSAAVLRAGKLDAIYRKHALPNYGVFDEMRYFTPGTALCVIDINGVAVGITLCEDVWDPGVVEASSEAGARLVLNLNASPFHAHKISEREKVIRDRTSATGLPIIYVNQVGGQDELVFDGASFVMNADGQVVYRAPEFEESLAAVDFDCDDQAVPMPNVVADAYDEVSSDYKALVLGIRDYVLKNGFKGAVLGLSGGIDSAVTLALAVDALGSDQVEVAMMPSRYTASMSNEDALEEAELLHVEHHMIPIELAFKAFNDSLEETFKDLPSDTTEENIQARCRCVILMAISNKKRRLLLTTGNKSEMSVGYSTLYGDMAGGFAPLKDVSKMLVYKLAEYRNSISRVIPERVITRPPSAELAPDQVDQDSLPPYSVLDAILALYVEQDKSMQDIIEQGYAETDVRRVLKLVDSNEYKRRQAPPGVRISARAFGRDRRYPITSGFRRE